MELFFQKSIFNKKNLVIFFVLFLYTYIMCPIIFAQNITVPANPPIKSDKKNQDTTFSKKISDGSTNKNIYISADKLVTDLNSKVAEFTGNVKASQENTTIVADKMTIYYSNDPTKKQNSNEDSIKRIEIIGKVKISFDNTVATSDKAVYIAETKVFELTGPNSKVTNGNNYITGEKISLYRTDGKVIVEKKVEAVLNSVETSLN
ncbi:MAG: hypothetical protein HQK76_05265 [Desulfobacterales bacterium]|nr:hypothetical protein [Desulfobacterales bacterium]